MHRSTGMPARWLAPALLALVIFTLPGASRAAEPPAPKFAGCGGVSVPAVDTSLEQQVVDLTNAERASAGLPPLKLVSELTSSARYHAADQAQDAYFNHDSYDRSGDTLSMACAWSSRIGSFYSGSSMAENIAAGYATPEAAVQGWMASDGHRRNILDAGLREIGVGYYAGGPYGRYWVQNFGTRSDVFPLVIDGEAAYTQSTLVTLYIYNDTTPWQEMRLRTDGGAWTAWQPYRQTLSYDLGAGDGLRTVSVELRRSGRSAASSDTIVLSAKGEVVLSPRMFTPIAWW